MKKLRHLTWLAVVALLIACGEPAIKGTHYGEDELGHGEDVAHVDEAAGEDAADDDHAEDDHADDVETVETPVPPTAIPTEEPTATLEPTVEVVEPTEVVEDAAVSGDPVRGQQVFNANACSACHMVDSQSALVGPGLQGVGAIAETRVEGMSAEDYLHEAIVDPNAHIVPGFSQGIMPATFGTTLSEDDLADLIAYLMSL